MVSTLKKSQARTPQAWVARRSRQDWAARLGAGSMPARCRISHTVPGPHLVSQTDQLALDAAVAPGRVLGGQAQDHVPDLASGRGPCGPPTRVPPRVGQEFAVPAQEGRR
jgi:hypothetical protein